jgi:hypothetical protein
LDAAGRFRLTGHAFDCLAADATDAETSAQDDEPGADCSTQVHRANLDGRSCRRASGWRLCHGRCGQNGKDQTNQTESNYVSHFLGLLEMS